jgi:hypothetical protein
MSSPDRDERLMFSAQLRLIRNEREHRTRSVITGQDVSRFSHQAVDDRTVVSGLAGKCRSILH